MKNAIGDKLKLMRGKQNLTQNQLGNIAGIAPSQISQYEAGRSKIGMLISKKLRLRLGVQLAILTSDIRLMTKTAPMRTRTIAISGMKFCY
ncbi:MAG: helix-turn-helix domain-containing protein [Planctomycetota bacterium]|jgi:transcriptional regulator with XRE-family HTH domain|nr:helix-turn-helix domain-containing protein [Planctomycetota bacterium]